jgi:Zn-dependent protease with chaperone function
VYRQPSLTREFDKIRGWIKARGSTRITEDYEPLVLETDVVNAWVVPSPQHKYVLFTPGLLKSFTQEELRCVIGHELAHIELGHRDGV